MMRAREQGSHEAHNLGRLGSIPRSAIRAGRRKKRSRDTANSVLPPCLFCFLKFSLDFHYSAYIIKQIKPNH